MNNRHPREAQEILIQCNKQWQERLEVKVEERHIDASVWAWGPPSEEKDFSPNREEAS